MKRKWWMFFILLWSTNLAFGQNEYQIKVKLQHFNQGKLYLGNYYGKNTFLIDTTNISENGTAIFEGKEKLPAGIYFILYPNKKKFFELLIGKDQTFGIQADTTENFKHLVFENNPINKLFKAYNQFLNTRQEKIRKAQNTGADSAQLGKINKQNQKDIAEYRNKQINKHPQTLLSNLFKAMKATDIPKDIQADPKASYQYLKNHYWDAVDFSDSGLVRSPILETKLNRYFKQIIPKIPDSINRAADFVLEKAKVNKLSFKFVLWWLTSTYERSPYMGMDAVFVHLVEQYYAKGDAYWLDENQLQRILGKAAKIAPNLIGNIAPEIIMQTPEGETVKLSDIKAKYLILAFWDPTCSHCKIVIPELDSLYREDFQDKSVKVVGVLSGGSKEQWIDFIHKHHLKDWINLWDPQHTSNYRRMYNVYQTPIIYLLDKNKKILAKQLSVEQVKDFLKGKEGR